MPTQAQALQAGLSSLKAKDYTNAIDELELFCQLHPDGASTYYLQAQMGLVKAYHATGQTQRAIALLHQLSDSSHPKVQEWVKQTLPKLTSSPLPATTTQPSSPQHPPIQATNVKAHETAATPQETNAAAATDLNQYLTQRVRSAPTPKTQSPQSPLMGVGAIALNAIRESSQAATPTTPSRLTSASDNTVPSSDASLKTLTMFHRHYQQELRIVLLEFEQQRRQIALTIIAIQIGLVAICIPILTLIASDAWGYVLGAYVTITSALYHQLVKPYRRDFKHKVIRKIVEFIDPNGSFTYSFTPHHQSNYTPFLTSRLFADKAPDRFAEEDCVSGTLGQTHIFFSEIHAERKIRNAKRRRRYVTIFRGLFFQANFNKSFKGTTFIFPDFAERFLGGLGKALQFQKGRHGELIKLEDPEFERLFAVYGSDQIEARYILSTSLMQRLVDLRKKVKQEIYVAFVANQIYIGISDRKDLFEPRIFRSMVEFGPVQEYFETLRMMLSIVEDLNLNLRIWKS
jgi:predicted negative regulator of RcsB-dependent stress response